MRPPAYRLPGATRLGAVRLQVSDLARSITYYERVLGMRVRDRAGDAATLGDAGGHALIRLEARPGVRPAPPRATLGLYHFAILLPDRPSLGRVIRHLAGLGARAGMADHLVSEAIYLTDPDGLGIEVYADRPRDSWRVNGQELAMTTDPLDAEAVVAAAGSEPWTGMPAGTVLGHVHLHVGDLDEGAAFYHAALGFDKVVWSYPGALFLSAGGYHHHLGTNTWSRGPAPAADQARLLSWDIVVPTQADAAEAAASITAAGYRIQEEDGAFRAADPWGTTLRLVPETV
ncbi:MAG TPA: VOC family protein [Vicinamibacterales bacterium]|nr:VOC family protein [Vicinamibacterales bacterium]